MLIARYLRLSRYNVLMGLLLMVSGVADWLREGQPYEGLAIGALGATILLLDPRHRCWAEVQVAIPPLYRTHTAQFVAGCLCAALALAALGVRIWGA